MYFIARLEKSRRMKNSRVFTLQTYFRLCEISTNKFTYSSSDYLMRLDHDFDPVSLFSIKKEHLEGPLKDYIYCSTIRNLVAGPYSRLDKKTTEWLIKFYEKESRETKNG
jgi:hypothetical protein